MRSPRANRFALVFAAFIWRCRWTVSHERERRSESNRRRARKRAEEKQ